jgi:VWFA-related protein
MHKYFLLSFRLDLCFVCTAAALISLPTRALAQQPVAAQQPAAQQPASQKPASDQSVATIKVQAREVLLPVTVRDKHGALVTNLQMSDFTLTEDGRPQVIKSLTRESNLPLAVGLLVDTSRSVAGAMEDERKAADKFVNQMLGGDAKAAADPPAAKPGEAPVAPDAAKASTKGDQAFLLHFDHEVELLQDFTASREKLHREIDGMGPTPHSQNDSQGPETTGDDRNHQGAGRGGTQLYDAVFLASDELMKPKDGRKALVVFSDGVDRGSKETMTEAIDAADHANLSIYTIYFKGEQERSDMGGFPGHRGGMGGGGYPGGGGGYPGGGGGYPGGGGGRRPSEPQIDGKKIMEKIAVQTGGRYFDTKKKQDLEEIYGMIADELHGQYLLTYTPDKEDNDGGYHKVELKAKNGDLAVITRAGYYAPGGDNSR